MALENPSGANTFYGYDGTEPALVPLPGHHVEAQKTEPDKNTYLCCHGPARRRPDLRLRHALPVPGPRARHARATSPAINLDADAAHRVTLLADTDVDGAAAAGDRRLDLGPVRPAAALHDRGRQRPAACSRPRSTSLEGARTSGASLGRGGYEGIQNDAVGNVCIVEDIGGGRHGRHTRQGARTASSTGSCPTNTSRPDAGRQAAGAAGRSRSQRRPIVSTTPGRRDSSRTTSTTCTPTARPSPRPG